MDPEKIEQLKELIREEPTVAATFATVDAEHTEAAAHTKTLADARRPLQQKLEKIEEAKAELAKLSLASASVDSNLEAEQEPQEKDGPKAEAKTPAKEAQPDSKVKAAEKGKAKKPE